MLHDELQVPKKVDIYDE